MPLRGFLKVLLSAVFLIVAVAIAKVGYSFNQFLPDINNSATYQQAYQNIIDIAISTWSTVVESIRDMSHDDWLAISTVLIAIFTGSLWWSTRRLWQVTSQTVNILADTERPHMQISQLKVSGLHNRPNAAGRVSCFLEFNFTNYGRSPAFLESSIMRCATIAELLPVPIYEGVRFIRFVTAVGNAYGSIKPSEFDFDADEIRQVLMGEQNMYIYGSLSYRGANKKTHKTRYAYRLIIEDGDASERFYPDGPDSYWENT